MSKLREELDALDAEEADLRDAADRVQASTTGEPRGTTSTPRSSSFCTCCGLIKSLHDREGLPCDPLVCGECGVRTDVDAEGPKRFRCGHEATPDRAARVVRESTWRREGKPLLVAHGRMERDLPGGSGSGALQRGAVVRDVSSLAVGMLLINDDKRFNSTNVVRVTEVNAERGNVHGVFVDPRRPSRKRLPSDREFCVWDYEFDNGAYRMVAR